MDGNSVDNTLSASSDNSAPTASGLSDDAAKVLSALAISIDGNGRKRSSKTQGSVGEDLQLPSNSSSSSLGAECPASSGDELNFFKMAAPRRVSGTHSAGRGRGRGAYSVSTGSANEASSSGRWQPEHIASQGILYSKSPGYRSILHQMSEEQRKFNMEAGRSFGYMSRQMRQFRANLHSVPIYQQGPPTDIFPLGQEFRMVRNWGQQEPTVPRPAHEGLENLQFLDADDELYDVGPYHARHFAEPLNLEDLAFDLDLEIPVSDDEDIAEEAEADVSQAPPEEACAQNSEIQGLQSVIPTTPPTVAEQEPAAEKTDSEIQDPKDLVQATVQPENGAQPTVADYIAESQRLAQMIRNSLQAAAEKWLASSVVITEDVTLSEEEYATMQNIDVNVDHLIGPKFDLAEYRRICKYGCGELNRYLKVESLSPEERGWLLKSVRECRELSVTLVYQDGSTQLRTLSRDTKKVTGLAVFFGISGRKRAVEVRMILIPMDICETPATYFYCRNLIGAIFENNAIVLAFKAQEIFENILSVYGASDHQVCCQWRLLDLQIMNWMLSPDNPTRDYQLLVTRFKHSEPTILCTSEEIHFMDMGNIAMVMKDMSSSMKKEGLWDLFIHIETPLLSVLAAMSQRKVQLDCQMMCSTSQLLHISQVLLENEACIEAGKTFSLNSPSQLREILYDNLHLDKFLASPKSHLTRKGELSTAEATLQLLLDYHKLPGFVLEYRKLQKMKGTYTDGILKYVKKNKLKTAWSQTAASTGRITSMLPNVQAIPKDITVVRDIVEVRCGIYDTSMHVINARLPFLADSGWSFLSADYKQIELRLLAHYTGDAMLLDVFRSPDKNRDIFKELGSLWLFKPPEEITENERVKTKQLVYSIMYGAGKDRLADNVRMTRGGAEHLRQRFLEKISTIEKFSTATIAFTKKNKYQVTLCGRRRYFYSINDPNWVERAKAERKAVNFKVQGSAADIIKAAMIKLEMILQSNQEYNAKILYTIHDELVLMVEDGMLPRIAKILKHVMEDTELLSKPFNVKLNVPLSVALFTGKSWGALSPLNL